MFVCVSLNLVTYVFFYLIVQYVCLHLMFAVLINGVMVNSVHAVNPWLYCLRNRDFISMEQGMRSS